MMSTVRQDVLHKALGELKKTKTLQTRTARTRV